MPSIESLLAYLEATSKFQAIVNIKTKKPCLLTQFSVKVLRLATCYCCCFCPKNLIGFLNFENSEFVFQQLVVRSGEQEIKSIWEKASFHFGRGYIKRWFCSYLWKIWNILKWIQPKVDRL